MGDDICALGAVEMLRLFQAGELSPVEAMCAHLDRIEMVQPALNAFCFVYHDWAMAAARAAEAAYLAGGEAPPLLGVPIAIKDFTPVAGTITTRGSATLKDWQAPADPVIVRRLLEAGAILVGKTTTPEFAFSSFTRSPLWGETRNPWHRDRTCGGSSGGSAVAVTTGCVALAEGSDMGGSIRIPAALCGVVGLKPSLGRIPMDILPTSFDLMSHFGPLARSVEDAALFLRVTEGPDDADILSQMRPEPLGDCLAGRVEGVRVALSPDLGFYRVDPDIVANLRGVAADLSAAGAVVEEIRLDWTVEVATAWASYWEVFLAAIVGHNPPAQEAIMDPDLVAVMRAGRQANAVEIKRLEMVRTRQWRALATVFQRFDVLICPTMAITAPPVTAGDADFEHVAADGYLHGFDMTAPFNNIAQCPTLSVPSGMSPDGLPTAVQIIGRRFDDPMVLRVGRAIERMRPFARWRLGSRSDGGGR
jgi:Asp-tRNA(Asn)/Glu-tRNA(Gln) amidotransferase A subunit family amidase